MRRYRCKRCNRPIKYPHFINGLPYGKECAFKIQSNIIEQINENRQSIQNIEKYLEEGIWKELPKHNPSCLDSFVSYENREELIEELVKVLQERKIIK